jgi:hypothetical protein
MKGKNKNKPSKKGENTSKISEKVDLTDSRKEPPEKESESFTIDLPDVKDIPGQEHIHPLPLGEIADTTISSDDEEGVGILDDDENQELSSTDQS